MLLISLTGLVYFYQILLMFECTFLYCVVPNARYLAVGVEPIRVCDRIFICADKFVLAARTKVIL